MLDIGCSDGILFRLIPGINGVGVEPALDKPKNIDNVKFLKGYFPEAVPRGEVFDKICMLAVLEHIPVEKQPQVAQSCFQHLKPNGYLIITVPIPAVDRILDVLVFMRLVEGIEIHQHYGFKPSKVPAFFKDAGLHLVQTSKS